MDTKDYFKPVQSCEKCKEAPPRHRYHFGYVQVVPGVRFLRYFMLCSECLQNAKIKNEGKQHPMWKLVDEGKRLELTDQTIWPDANRGRNYGAHLKHPSARGVMDAGS